VLANPEEAAAIAPHPSNAALTSPFHRVTVSYASGSNTFTTARAALAISVDSFDTLVVFVWGHGDTYVSRGFHLRMGLILLLLLAGFVLFLLLAGAGLLFFVLRRSKQNPKGPNPQLESRPFEPAFGPPPGALSEPSIPDNVSDNRASLDVAPPADASPWGVPSPPPASFETRGPDDRVARDTQANERAATVAMYSNAGPGTSPIRDPALFETTPSADATAPFGGSDPFATTPSTPPASPELPPAPKATLRDASGAIVQVDPTGTRVGRHPECKYIIPTPGASRYHAEIRFEEGAWIISDLNSGNGTFVNGVRIRTHQLAPGDEVRIDQTILTFHLGE
jgi:hypothetical protein